MSESLRRPSERGRGTSSRRRAARCLPGAVLALVFLAAAPAYAEPDAPPGAGRSGDAPAQTGDLPAPSHAAAHDAVVRDTPQEAPPVPQGPPDDVPQGPPDDVPAGPPADVPAGPPAGTPANPDTGAGPAADVPAAQGARGQKVVVCKYVRKPGVAEVFSHIIVVNENALLGKGFAGVFPFAFSDAHFKSVAVRFAARGEQASEISEAACPAGTPPVDEPPVEEPPGEEPPGEVGGIVEDGGPGASGGEPRAGLPSTGSDGELLVLGLLGLIATLGGSWLVLGSRKAVVR